MNRQSLQPHMSLTEAQPAARLDGIALAEQMKTVGSELTIIAILDAFPGPAVILNDRRQIVAANAQFRDAARPAIGDPVGHRPGDALGCVEAAMGIDGCGTAEACLVCGAGKALTRLEHGAHSPVREECLITRACTAGREEALEFEAGLTRLPGDWTLLALRDISGEKRRNVLEQCFIHDAINTAGAVQSLAYLSSMGDTDCSHLLPEAVEALVEELRHQQLLMAAERGELLTRQERFDLADVCADVVRFQARHPVANNRRLVMQVEATPIVSDRVLVRRIAINLAKNALEAVPAGTEVVLSCRPGPGTAILEVINPGTIPAHVQLQLFKRSFSTKGQFGRGIGTWSVKLLTERYLGGSVGFTSGVGRTAFTVTLPLG